jgi:hypothetical protein
LDSVQRTCERASPRADDETLRVSNHLIPRVKAVEGLTGPRFVQLIQSEAHKDGLKTLLIFDVTLHIPKSETHKDGLKTLIQR